MKLFKLLIAITFLNMILSCSEKLVTVEVEKEYSWKEENRFNREGKIIVNTGKDENGIYFQQPGCLSTCILKNGIAEITTFPKMFVPFDINFKLPLKCNYIPIPWEDSVIYLTSLTKVYGAEADFVINLKKIDTSFTKLVHPYILEEMMTINSNGTLLIHYNDRNGFQSNYKFMLVGVESNQSRPYIDTTFTKTVEVERSRKGLVGYQLRYFTAIDDYFIIDLGEDGIVKMNQNGTFKKVINSYAGFNFVYKYHQRVYAAGEPDKIYISNDDGETWNTYQVDTWLLSRGKHSIINDSLVGYYLDNIFTQVWNNNNYTLKFLNNDGLEHKHITGIEVLGDSVYVGTLSGLFVKPLSTFFEEKK